jgi:hypothetical protein
MKDMDDLERKIERKRRTDKKRYDRSGQELN